MSEFEQRIGRTTSGTGEAEFDPNSDISQSNVRAQDQFDTAVDLLRFGAGRVILEVGKNGRADYTLVPREPQNDSGESLASFLPLGRVPYSSQAEQGSNGQKKTKATGPKKGKRHDLRGYNGFYRGTFYSNGVARPAIKKKK